MRRTISYSILGILLLALVFGCAFGMTLEGRIQNFASDLNLADRTDIYKNFHSTDTVDYPAISDGGFFDIDFRIIDLGDPFDRYVISILDTSNPLQVTATISNPALWAGGPWDAQFSMEYEGFDYKIVTFQINYGTGMEDVVR